MAIPNYLRPQLTIKQLLDRTPSASVGRINAIVVGPQYLLARYGKETLPENTFSSSEATLSYRNIDDDGATVESTGSNVDLNSVKLWAENLEAVVATNVNDGVNHEVYVPDLSSPNVLRITDHGEAHDGAVTEYWKGSTIATALKGRPMQVGDVVYVTAAGTTRRRTVTGFRGKAVAAAIGTMATSTSNPTPAAAAFTGGSAAVTNAGAATDFDTAENYGRGPTYQGKFGDKFTLTVIEGGATPEVSVTSTSGLYSSASVVGASDGGTGYDFGPDDELGGMTINIDTGAELVVGATYTYTIFGTYADPVINTEVAVTGTTTATRDTTLIFKVTGTNDADGDADGATFMVTDTAGLLTPTTIEVLTDGVAVVAGLGVSLTVELGAYTQGFLRVGDVLHVPLTAATESTTVFDRLILSGPAVDTSIFTDPTAVITTVKVVKEFSGEIKVTDASDGTAWTADSDGVTVDATMALYDSLRSSGNEWMAYDDAVGKLYVEYRELIPAASGEALITIDGLSDITENLGTIDLDNDLAYAASLAFNGAQNQRVYALKVGSDDAAGFATALAKTESTDMVYAFAIISNDSEVKSLAKTHVLAMSTEEQKKFRRAYVGTESPGQYVKLSEDSAGDNLEGAFTGATGNVLVSSSPGVDFTTLGLVGGVDKVRYVGDDSYYVIQEVDTADTLILETGPGAPTASVQIEIVKADTPASQIAYVKEVSEGLGSRRVVNIWTEGGTVVSNGSTLSVPNRFLAAEVAGLRSAVLPQQGLTRTEITAITDASRMYSRYTPSQLDEVAAAGTFIITQDIESGAIYIRHQLTTDTNDGSLYYEDSVGVSLDNISFAVKDVLSGYIGKFNVTPATISRIRNEIFATLAGFTRTELGSADIGPALIDFDNLIVEADSVLKDRINVSAQLIFPLPLNNIAVTLQASVDTSL